MTGVEQQNMAVHLRLALTLTRPSLLPSLQTNVMVVNMNAGSYINPWTWPGPAQRHHNSEPIITLSMPGTERGLWGGFHHLESQSQGARWGLWGQDMGLEG